MKWVWIAVLSGAVIDAAHAWPSHHWGRSVPAAGFAQPYSYYGAGEFVGPYGGSYSRPYLNPSLYGSYPYRPLHYSGLYPTYGQGEYYRNWPYYPSYTGAYPYSYNYGTDPRSVVVSSTGVYPNGYNYGYRFGSYSIFSGATREGYEGGPETVHLYQFPERSNDLEDVDKTWAWGYMAEGNYDRASGIFAAMERQTPGAGWPKIGTGLMAGFSGDYRKATYQFRRAFRFDPSNPGLLPTEQNLQDKLRKMASHYKREANNGRKPDADAEFMVAALSFLSGDNIAAQNAVEKAILHGDNSRSARNLKQLVDNALDQRHDELLAAEQRR